MPLEGYIRNLAIARPIPIARDGEVSESKATAFVGAGSRMVGFARPCRALTVGDDARGQQPRAAMGAAAAAPAATNPSSIVQQVGLTIRPASQPT
jgi:hypothetical protein